MTELAIGPTSVVTLTLADEPSDAEVWSEVCAVGSATLAVSAPAPTSTVSTLGVFVEVELTFRVGAVTWLFTAAEVSPGVPPIDSAPIWMRRNVAPPMSVLLYMACPLIAAPAPTTAMMLSVVLLFASTRTLPFALTIGPRSVCAIVWSWIVWMAPAAAAETRPARLNEPANELRFSFELARISTLLLELTSALDADVGLGVLDDQGVVEGRADAEPKCGAQRPLHAGGRGVIPGEQVDELAGGRPRVVLVRPSPRRRCTRPRGY